MPTTHEIEKAIGVSALIALSREFGGTRIYVPSSVARDYHRLRPADRARIVELRKKHRSIRRIALEMRVSERVVYRVLMESAPATSAVRAGAEISKREA